MQKVFLFQLLILNLFQKVKEMKQPILKNKMREYRARLDISQDTLAKAVGLSRLSICRIEDGGWPNLRTAMLIAQALEANVDEIFFVES